MTNPEPMSLSRRSPLLRFFRWLFSWRGIRCLLIVFAWGAALVALTYAEENWRGRRAWTRCRQDLQARGKVLDFRAMIPKPVPDEQNFADTPFVRSWFAKRGSPSVQWGDAFAQAVSMVPGGGSGGGKGKPDRRFVDLVGWKMAFEAVQSGERKPKKDFQTDQLDRESRAKAAPAVLEGLKSSDPILDELRTASQRPLSRYPVVYDLENPWEILLPHLAHVKACVQRLQLRACASLAAGRSDPALADVKCAFRLADSIKEEPFLISYLVRLASVQLAIHPIWEGLAEHRWSEGQLLDLQAILLEYDFLTDLIPPLDTERAAAILTVDILGQRGNLDELTDTNEGGTARGRRNRSLLVRLIPSGWLDLEKLNYCRLLDRLEAGTVNLTAKRVFPSRIQSNMSEFEAELAGGRLGQTASSILHHRLIASLLLPALGKVSLKAAVSQTTAGQAAVACALERYRLSNGKLPERLDLIAPKFIPQMPTDPISGQPYKYERTSDGRCLLYSVGWNGTDDGGVLGKKLFDENQGDWVWEYPGE